MVGPLTELVRLVEMCCQRDWQLRRRCTREVRESFLAEEVKWTLVSDFWSFWGLNRVRLRMDYLCSKPGSWGHC